MNDTFDNNLEHERPFLSKEEKVRMLQNVTKRTAASVVSPYTQFVRGRVVAPLAVVVAMVVATGTVAAAESAKPGDLLFPIDRASEEVLLTFAPDDKKSSLRTKFNDERLLELRGIINEVNKSSENTDAVVDTVGEERISRAVAEILNYAERAGTHEDKKAFLTALMLVVDEVTVEGHERSDEHKVEGDSKKDESRLRIDDKRIEIRDDGYRIRIDDDGEVRIKKNDDSYEDGRHRSDDSADDDEDSESEDSHEGRGDAGIDDDENDDGREYQDFEDSDYEDAVDDESDDEQRGIEKFEVRVEDGRAEVHLKYDGQEDEFETTFVSEEELVAEVAGRTGLSIEELIQALDIEVKE
ncbi:MAG: hypothetical protein RLZZ480_554 [Candidatus Parcubacteria bacterium]|jgi:hypothetical protein